MKCIQWIKSLFAKKAVVSSTNGRRLLDLSLNQIAIPSHLYGMTPRVVRWQLVPFVHESNVALSIAEEAISNAKCKSVAPSHEHLAQSVSATVARENFGTVANKAFDAQKVDRVTKLAIRRAHEEGLFSRWEAEDIAASCQIEAAPPMANQESRAACRL